METNSGNIAWKRIKLWFSRELKQCCNEHFSPLSISPCVNVGWSKWFLLRSAQPAIKRVKLYSKKLKKTLTVWAVYFWSWSWVNSSCSNSATNCVSYCKLIGLVIFINCKYKTSIRVPQLWNCMKIENVLGLHNDEGSFYDPSCWGFLYLTVISKWSKFGKI